nr:unnamed protein product [Callosobruchus chinensis]
MMASPVTMNETNHVIYNRTERYCYLVSSTVGSVHIEVATCYI